MGTLWPRRLLSVSIDVLKPGQCWQTALTPPSVPATSMLYLKCQECWKSLVRFLSEIPSVSEGSLSPPFRPRLSSNCFWNRYPCQGNRFCRFQLRLAICYLLDFPAASAITCDVGFIPRFNVRSTSAGAFSYILITSQ